MEILDVDLAVDVDEDGTADDVTAAATTATDPPAGSVTDAAPAGGRRRGLTVIEAGMVHPVSGPPIENGVVVIRGERILAPG